MFIEVSLWAAQFGTGLISPEEGGAATGRGWPINTVHIFLKAYAKA